MPEARVRRKRGSQQQWDAVVRQYEASGLSQAQFCRRHRVALSSLQRWRQRRRKDRGAAKFVELVADAKASTSAWSLEVALPGGATLRFQG